MDFQPTEDQTLLVESARKIVESEIRPILDRNVPDRPLSKAEMLNIFAIFARHSAGPLWCTELP